MEILNWPKGEIKPTQRPTVSDTDSLSQKPAKLFCFTKFQKFYGDLLLMISTTIDDHIYRI